jgi:hypothetical protein
LAPSRDFALLERVETHHRLTDLLVHVLDRVAHSFAAVAVAAIAQLHGLVRAGAGTARHRGAAARARYQLDLDLDRRVTTGVEDLACVDVRDAAHDVPSLWLL